MEQNMINKGTLFANDKKGNDKAPDYKGKVDVDGKTLNIAGWWRRAKNSDIEYLSLSISEYTPKNNATEKKDDLLF